jgi:hypothetical protein
MTSEGLRHRAEPILSAVAFGPVRVVRPAWPERDDPETAAMDEARRREDESNRGDSHIRTFETGRMHKPRGRCPAPRRRWCSHAIPDCRGSESCDLSSRFEYTTCSQPVCSVSSFSTRVLCRMGLPGIS